MDPRLAARRTPSSNLPSSAVNYGMYGASNAYSNNGSPTMGGRSLSTGSSGSNWYSAYKKLSTTSGEENPYKAHSEKRNNGGWVQKKARTPGLWKRRYLKLSNDRVQWLEEEGGKVLGQILLKDCNPDTCIEILKAKSSSSSGYRFNFTSKHRTINFSVETKEECIKWANNIMTAVRLVANPESCRSLSGLTVQKPLVARA